VPVDVTIHAPARPRTASSSLRPIHRRVELWGSGGGGRDRGEGLGLGTGLGSGSASCR